MNTKGALRKKRVGNISYICFIKNLFFFFKLSARSPVELTLWRNTVLVFPFSIRYLPSGASLVAQTVKNPPAMQGTWVWSLVGKIPWRREWQPTPVFLSGEFHGQRSLVGYISWGHKELDTTEWLTHLPSRWEGSSQEGHRSPNRGNSLQVSDIFISPKHQEETN